MHPRSLCLTWKALATDHQVSYNFHMSPSEKPEPKFRRRANARPDEVLDAALALFIDQGFARTSVDQVAQRAGISKGAVYLYFPSKEAILAGLVSRTIAPLTDALFDNISRHKGDPRPAIEQFLRMMGKVLTDKRNRAVPLIVIHEAPAAPEIATLFRTAVLDRAIPALSTLLAQGVEGGHIRPIDPELTARTVIGPILAHIIFYEIFGIEPEGGFHLDRLIENHLLILNAGLEPQKG
ncbi:MULTISPECIES: TetR/AcrR family transcriptional regulator [Falsihalocynthiibacter]|uniref:TetR/AcrR family transcriptional regulator n=1 Tax=Falsihalocynthiibacter TaxID=2854182 RepID=UPI0030034091